jgi:hypothetical protein
LVPLPKGERPCSYESGSGACSLVGLLAGWCILGADAPKKEKAFTADYLLVETQDGARTVLEQPRLATLGDKTYVVGRTRFLEGVSNDLLLNNTIQWVPLNDARRLAEADTLDLLHGNAVEAKARRVTFTPVGQPIKK